MAMNSCCQCVKSFFVLINLLITLIGLALLGCALWLFFDTFHYLQIAQASNEYYSGTYVFMAVGVLMTVVGFLGCVGACRESPCLLGTFFTLVLLVFVAEVASIAWLHVNSDQLRDELDASIKRAIQREYGRVKFRTQTLDVIQDDLQCCGADGPADWAGAHYNRIQLSGDLNSDSSDAAAAADESLLDSAINAVEVGVSGVAAAVGAYSVPASCCIASADASSCEQGRRLAAGGQLAAVISSDGCAERLVDYLQQHMGVVVGVAVLVMVVELLAMLVALCLCVTVVRSEQRYKA